MPHIDDGTLHALLDGALRAEEPGRVDAVEAHLDACADCRARLEHAAALRDEAAGVLASLDAGLSDGDAPASTPDFGEVLARAAAGSTGDGRATGATGDPSARPPTDTARLRRQLGWTRGLAWAATIVVALGTGYIIRDMAGPTGEVPATSRSAAPREQTPEPVSATEPAVVRGGEADRMQPAETDAAEIEAAEVQAADGAVVTAPRPDAPMAQDVAGPEAPAARDLAGADASGAGAEAQKVAGFDTARAGAAEEAEAVQIVPMAVRARAPRQEAAPTLMAEAEAPAAVSALRDVSGDPIRRSEAGADLPGCYALELGAWSPARDGSDASYQTPPAVFELMDSVGPPAETAAGRGTGASMEEGQRILRPLIGYAAAQSMGWPAAFWAPVPPDSVRLVWTNGYVGVTLRLGIQGDALVGRARAFTDAIVPGRTSPGATARAVRVECPENDG